MFNANGAFWQVENRARMAQERFVLLARGLDVAIALCSGRGGWVREKPAGCWPAGCGVVVGTG